MEGGCIMKKYFFPWYNFVLLFGLGFYLMFYCFSEDIDTATGVPVIAGTLMGYALYSTGEFIKAKKSNS